MSYDSRARSLSAMPSSVDTDYDAIHATIVATERGRWFLEEHARRNRASDTELVLTAVERVEQSLRSVSTGGQRAPAQSALLAIVKRISETRSDLLARHGDPAAAGDAALADFRIAVEQIQELVWDMHGRDGGSEFGSQLSLHTKRLTADGDKLERSLSSLRILLELLDDLDQRLRQLAGSPAPAEDTKPDAPAIAVVAPAPQPDLPSQPVSLRSDVVPWSLPAEALQAPPAPNAEPEAPADADAQLTGLSQDTHSEQPPEAAAEFELLWDEPKPLSQPIERSVDMAAEAVAEPDEPSAEAATETAAEVIVADWVTAPDESEPTPESGIDSSASEARPEPHRQPERPAAEQLPTPAPERFEAGEYRQQHDAPFPRPSLEAAAAAAVARAVAQPRPATLDDLAAKHDSSTAAAENFSQAPEEPAPAAPIAVLPSEPAPLSEPAAESGGQSSADEWIEVPAGNFSATEVTFDADLFESDDSNHAAQSAENTPADKVVDEIDWLAADDGEARPNTMAASFEPVSLFADEIAESEPEAAKAPDADLSPTATETLTDLAYLAEDEPEPGPTAEQSEPMSLLDTLTEPSAPEQPSARPAAIDSLYGDSSYDEPATSVRAYADRAYHNRTDGEPSAAASAPARPAYQWPSTFAEKTADEPRPVAQPSAGTRASAAYQALQPQSVTPSPAAAPPVPSREPVEDAPQPLLQEDPDVPSVLERLESVRSAIAALMDDVNDKTADDDPSTSRG